MKSDQKRKKKKKGGKRGKKKYVIKTKNKCLFWSLLGKINLFPFSLEFSL